MLEIGDKVVPMSMAEMQEAYDLGVETFGMHCIQDTYNCGQRCEVIDVGVDTGTCFVVLDSGYLYNEDLVELA